MLLFAVALTLNPHADLWLDDAAFSLRYCPGDRHALVECRLRWSALAEQVSATTDESERVALWGWMREVERDARGRREALAREVGRLRDCLRSNPSERPMATARLGPPTSGNP